MRPLDGGARFRAPLAWTSGASAGFVVPPEILIELGGGYQPSIVATVKGFRFTASIGQRDGWHWLPADERAVAGAAFGQVLEVELELIPRPLRANRACRPGRPARPGCQRPR
jgi:hypothetical protein